MAAGVPVVCLPQGRDQRDNAARVQRLGAGIRFGKRATSAAIAGAIREVLDNDHYRAAAAAFAGLLAVEAENLLTRG